MGGWLERGSDAEITWSLRWALLGGTVSVAATLGVEITLWVYADALGWWAPLLIAATGVVGILVTRKLFRAGFDVDNGREAREELSVDDPDRWLT